MRHAAGLKGQQRVGLRAGLVFASADDGRSLEIKLSQIGASLPVLGIQFDGAFKRGADFSCQAGCGKKSGAVGFLSINAAQPEMVEALLRIEFAGAFAGGNAAVPLFHHEIGAAEQVIGFGVGGGVADLLFQNSEWLHRRGRWREVLWQKSSACAARSEKRSEQYGERKNRVESRATIGTVSFLPSPTEPP